MNPLVIFVEFKPCKFGVVIFLCCVMIRVYIYIFNQPNWLK